MSINITPKRTADGRPYSFNTRCILRLELADTARRVPTVACFEESGCRGRRPRRPEKFADTHSPAVKISGRYRYYKIIILKFKFYPTRFAVRGILQQGLRTAETSVPTEIALNISGGINLAVSTTLPAYDKKEALRGGRSFAASGVSGAIVH